MLYENASEWFGWPSSNQVFKPEGGGARMYVNFAQKKIGGALMLAHPGVDVQVGILTPDSNSQNTESPLAVVCQFPRGASDDVLKLAHKLAWNFSRTALLITLEPHQLVAWSCYQDPTAQNRRICELPTPEGFKPSGTPEQRNVRDLLHWVSLLTNRVQQRLPKQFPADGRADALLLKNLKYVRRELLKAGLPEEHCHDLLARVIFTQFLFHRKDSAGVAFFSEKVMKRLNEDGILSKVHSDLGSVLANKKDIYSLFRWMDDRFNGDLFPGKEGDSDDSREEAWRLERDAVKVEHLNLVRDLVRGDLDVNDKQLTLWPHYSFDTIPLEFISSVYEEFITETDRKSGKAYYTPPHLVDYVLDAVLPWNGDDWNLRVLDPCCGSGIFLVKAFQRIIHRWRIAHGRDPLVTDLRPILANNFVGVDKNKEAVRVACFSLYLAMVDAIDPKHYITRDKTKVFPRLRGKQLLPVDFFDESIEFIRTEEDKDSFDLVIGNAPWGDKSIVSKKLPNEDASVYDECARNNPTKAQTWSKNYKWPVANHDIGPVFLGKAARLVKASGRVAMVETAQLLYWRDGKAEKLRRHLFTSYTFEEVTNLAALRRDIFSEAIGSACAVVFSKNKPEPKQLFYYFNPKPIRGTKSTISAPTRSGFLIEPQDVAQMTHAQAASEPWAWSVLSMGSKRHLLLINKLANFPTLAKLEASQAVEIRKGVILGDGKQRCEKLDDKPILKSPNFPVGVFLELDAGKLPKWKNASIDTSASVDCYAFKSPQLLIKLSYVARLGRLRAVKVKPLPDSADTVCQQAYVTIHDLNADEKYLRSAGLAYNSQFAVFFFALTSGSFPLYISKMSVGELANLPLPKNAPELTKYRSFDDIDAEMCNHFDLTNADRYLIEDFLKYTLPDLLRKTPGPARFQTSRKGEPELSEYVKTFTRVVQGTFGKNRTIAGIVYNEPDARHLPVRMVTLQLNAISREPLTIQPIEADGLLDLMSRFHAEQLDAGRNVANGGRQGFQRVAYFFHPSKIDGIRVMNLTIIKPDECRYWTRSMAMRDADQLAAAIVNASTNKKGRD